MYQRVNDEITVYQKSKTERFVLKNEKCIDQKKLFKVVFFQQNFDLTAQRYNFYLFNDFERDN